MRRRHGGTVLLLVVLLAVAGGPGPVARPAVAVSSSSPATVTPSPSPSPGSVTAAVSRPPVLAYYYIWFNASSWNRAKRDLPRLGRYSSDETSVMRAHVREAKAAGITGFLVSWKDTPLLDERLDRLVGVAREESFHLGIVYQGLDFAREPLPVLRVRHDLQLFVDRWGTDPVFDLDGPPIVIWGGTPRFSPADVGSVARVVRPAVRLLASESSTDRWDALGPVLDGNAYYWSSVDPARDTRAGERLARMSHAVHARQGMWIAPVAPGFDARLLGGTRLVEREGGETLRREWSTALASAPDAVGLISWNEFSEGTYVEPSRVHGDTALRTLAELTGAPGPQGELDSSSPGGRSSAGPWRAAAIALLLGGTFVLALLRTRGGRRGSLGHRRVRAGLP